MHILGYDESIFEDAKTKLKEQIIELPSLKLSPLISARML